MRARISRSVAISGLYEKSVFLPLCARRHARVSPETRCGSRLVFNSREINTPPVGTSRAPQAGDCASSGGDNVKHFNLIPSTSMNDAANAVTRVVPSGKAVLAPFAALLITAFALGTAGCGKSKNNSQSANQNQAVPESASNQNLAETAPSTIPVAVNQPEAGKKNSVKGPVKRASVRTFKD